MKLLRIEYELNTRYGLNKKFFNKMILLRNNRSILEMGGTMNKLTQATLEVHRALILKQNIISRKINFKSVKKEAGIVFREDS